MKKLENFMVREIADEYVMMPVGKTAQKFNGLVMANAVSAFIWTHIEEAKDVESLAQMICEEFEVSYEEALGDTTELIEAMQKAGWIEG